jgi:hypothetical protein
MTVLAIDPGNTESAYVIIDGNRRPVDFGKLSNADLLRHLRFGTYDQPEVLEADHHVIEMVASYGMPVGADVFETCVWIGRFYETITYHTLRAPALVKRHPVKVHHCHAGNASDANIKQALIDRFAPGVRNHGKGTKAAPGWFHGFRADVWQAYALAVYVADEVAP